MKDEYIFVDEGLNFSTGADAREKLAKTNDLTFLNTDAGVVSVTKDRWATAQAYELRTWMEASAHAADDRNEAHAKSFANYEVLKARSFRRAIELGCGPFTNLRVIARETHIGSCVLLDPLVQSYLRHRHCTYTHGKLQVRRSRLARSLDRSIPGRFTGRLLRRFYPNSLIDGPTVERLVATPIEEMPEVGDFDLVVMINVIEHCFDIKEIFRKILTILRPGAFLVFHDRLFDPAEVARALQHRYDAGHPLRVAGNLVEQFLATNFHELYSLRETVQDALGEIDLSERGIFFIGEARRV